MAFSKVWFSHTIRLVRTRAKSGGDHFNPDSILDAVRRLGKDGEKLITLLSHPNASNQILHSYIDDLKLDEELRINALKLTDRSLYPAQFFLDYKHNASNYTEDDIGEKNKKEGLDEDKYQIFRNKLEVCLDPRPESEEHKKLRSKIALVAIDENKNLLIKVITRNGSSLMNWLDKKKFFINSGYEAQIILKILAGEISSQEASEFLNDKPSFQDGHANAAMFCKMDYRIDPDSYKITPLIDEDTLKSLRKIINIGVLKDPVVDNVFAISSKEKS